MLTTRKMVFESYKNEIDRQSKAVNEYNQREKEK